MNNHEILEKNHIKVVDSLCSSDQHKIIQNILEGLDFAWYYLNSTVTPDNYTVVNYGKIKESFQFFHLFYSTPMPGINSQFYKNIEPLINLAEENIGLKLKPIRIKSNLLVKQEFAKDYYNPPHTDTIRDGNYISMVYYINDSDGDTVFFKETIYDKPNILTEIFRQSPKMGTAVIFNSKQYHASTPPIENNRRIIINFVFEVL